MNEIGSESVPRSQNSFGRQLRAWRSSRGLSQLSLSMIAGVSARHLSCLETGRASPSREMVLTLAHALDVPLRDRNVLLQAAGFAPIYRETPLDAHSMAPVREAIELLLGATEPNPTFVVNRRYDVLDANETGQWILATFTREIEAFTKPYNFGKLLVSSKGMRPHLENWEEVARKVLGRLQRELGGAHSRAAADDALLEQIAPALAAIGEARPSSEALPLLVPVRLRHGGLALRLFTTIATLGTPLDVTLQELRIETLFPADAESKRVLTSRPTPC